MDNDSYEVGGKSNPLLIYLRKVDEREWSFKLEEIWVYVLRISNVKGSQWLDKQTWVQSLSRHL